MQESPLPVGCLSSQPLDPQTLRGGVQRQCQGGFRPIARNPRHRKHLAFSVGIRLACHQTPLPDVLPGMTRFSTLLDKVVDRGQYVVWCDRRTLIAEEIDEHIQDGHKIWDLEFGGGPIPNCRQSKVALVCLHIVELNELVEIHDRIAGLPIPSLRRREANRGGFFCGPSVPNKSQDFTLVSAGDGREGVIHSRGVNHGDMCLIS
jgi:hypothetical protein